MVGYGTQTRLSTLLPIGLLNDCLKRVFVFWWVVVQGVSTYYRRLSRVVAYSPSAWSRGTLVSALF